MVNVSRKKAVGAYRGPLLFRQVSGSPLKYGKRVYRGAFLVQATRSSVMLVNRLRMEDYLRGVVPSEMPAFWHPEALKSQAVAARSYARATMRSGAFDFYADTRSQVYGAAPPRPPPRTGPPTPRPAFTPSTADARSPLSSTPPTEATPRTQPTSLAPHPTWKPSGTLMVQAGPSRGGSTL